MLAWEPFEKTTIKNDRTEMLSNNLSAKPIVQNVRPKMLAEKASEKLSPKITVLKCCLKIFRENSRSKCPYRNSSWKSVRKTITENNVLKFCLPKTVSTKPVVQNVRTEMLADWRNAQENYQ